uniref:Uncharacterized protein n=1 Tax=Panagrolaimus davidi TaxID=227884 RepID=A0A914QXF2_9BILA
MDNLDALSSDGENYVQNGDDVKFVRDSGKVGLELTNNELKFQFCSDGCMGKRVLVCYDCENSNEALQGDCDLNQCDFRAGVKKDDEGMAFRRQNFLWFISTAASRLFDETDKICESIVMKSPEAEVTFRTTPIKSCDPKKYDGKVIKLSVSGVKHGCPLYVLNAKKWTPPLTTLPTTQNSSTQITQTTPKSSEANTRLWIGIGVGIFVLLIIFIYLLIF